MAKDPARDHIEHRVNELVDKKKQAQDRFDAEHTLYRDTTEAIEVELAAWERILNPLVVVEPDAPAAKKAAAPKKATDK